MDLGIQDRVAVVTAASRGMGKAIAEALAAEGCKLAICSRDSSAIAAAAEEIRGGHGTAVFHKAVDVSDIDALRAFVAEAREALGPISIAVANAGGPPGGRFENFGAEDWQAAFRLNFLSTWALIESSCQRTVSGVPWNNRGRMLLACSIRACFAILSQPRSHRLEGCGALSALSGSVPSLLLMR